MKKIVAIALCLFLVLTMSTGSVLAENNFGTEPQQQNSDDHYRGVPRPYYKEILVVHGWWQPFAKSIQAYDTNGYTGTLILKSIKTYLGSDSLYATYGGMMYPY